MEDFSQDLYFENFTQSPQDSFESLDKTQHNHKKQFECPFPDCGKKFRYNSEKNRHLITHESARSYTCDYPFCTKKFKRLDALKVHRQSHSEQPQFLCQVRGCGLQFKDRPALKYHLNRQHYLSKHEHKPRNLHLFRKEQQSDRSQVYLDSDTINAEKDVLNERSQDFYDEFKSIDMINIASDMVNFSVENLSPKPKKLLCVEAEKLDFSPLKNSFGYSQLPKDKKDTEAKGLSKDVHEESLASNEVNTIQLLCKKLQLENQELKNKLADQMTSLE